MILKIHDDAGLHADNDVHRAAYFAVSCQRDLYRAAEGIIAVRSKNIVCDLSERNIAFDFFAGETSNAVSAACIFSSVQEVLGYIIN